MEEYIPLIGICAVFTPLLLYSPHLPEHLKIGNDHFLQLIIHNSTTRRYVIWGVEIKVVT